MAKKKTNAELTQELEKALKTIEELKASDQSGESKTTESSTSEKIIDIVYPYVDKFAQWEELKYSLRSLEKNFRGVKFRVWVVGDKPKWMSNEVNVIPATLIPGSNPPLDITNKMSLVIENKEIGEDFIWMNDDIYFINKVVLEDIKILKHQGDMSRLKIRENTLYRKNKIKTLKLLKKEKCTTWDYSTHLPFIYNKEKLKALIEKFNLKKEAYLISSLYNNYYNKDMIPLELNHERDNIKVGIYRKDPNIDRLPEFLKRKKMFNHSQTGFSDIVKQTLKSLFPDKSKFEN